MDFGMIQDGIAYIPAGNGQYMQLNCFVMEIQQEMMHYDHFSRGGLKDNRISQCIDQTIILKARDVQFIDEIPGIVNEVSGTVDLHNFSNLDLLKELEKRTKTDS